MKKRLIPLLVFVFFFGIIAGYAQLSAKTEQGETAGSASVQRRSIAEQKKEAYEILKEILELSDSPERRKNLPEIKALYRKIVDTYPDLALAQESYMRLVILAKEENTPEGDAEAERVYKEFQQKYPNSRLQRVIENELER